MRIFRSLSVVSAFMIGGWISGTSAIGVRRHRDGPSSSGASLPDR